MASNVGIPEGFEVEYNPNGIPEGFELETKKGIDLTPGGIYKSYRALLDVPSTQTKERITNGKRLSFGEAYKINREAQEQAPLNKVLVPIIDTIAYNRLPMANVAKGGGLGASVVNNALTNAGQGAVIGGLEGLKEDASLEGALGGTTTGALVGGTIGGAVPVVAPVGKALLNSPVVTKVLPKIQELTTSVPAEYSERAIQKELAGDSIFKGKFDLKDLNKNYYEAGQKAVNGIKALEMDANKAIHDATVGLNNLPLINRTKLVEKLASDIDSFRFGGDRNPAIDQKGKEIMEYLNQVASDKTNSALAGTKGNIQALVSGKYGKETGEGIMALKGMGHTINEELRNLSPDYALANDARANLYAIRDNLGGLNHKTVASRLRNAEGDSAIRSGYNQSAEELDSLVAPEYKFLDEVKDLRAREALESWFPGQYGGFGGAQGGANAGRLLAGGFGVSATRNPAVLGLFSPKIFGQGTIKGLGAIYKALGKELPRELITPLIYYGTAKGVNE